MDDKIEIEVAAATPERQVLIPVSLPPGATIADAIEVSEVARALPDIDATRCEVAIWGRLAGRVDALHDGDRVELLRPLKIDPRDTRRQLAESGQVMGQGSRAGQDDD